MRTMPCKIVTAVSVFIDCFFWIRVSDNCCSCEHAGTQRDIAAGHGVPRARGRWGAEGKEEGVVVRTLRWDTSKHILVICYSNPGNSVQMPGIPSRRSRVRNTLPAAAVSALGVLNFREQLLPLFADESILLISVFLFAAVPLHRMSCKRK